MLGLMQMLPIRRVALTLSVVAVLGLASGPLPGASRGAPLAQVEPPYPTICSDSFGGNCSWS